MTVPPNSAAKSAAIFGSQPSSRTVEGIRQTELMSVHTDVRELAGFTLLRPLRWWRRGWRRWRGLGVRSDKTRHCGTDGINRLRTPCLAALSCRFSFWRLPALSFHCRLLACFLMAVDRATFCWRMLPRVIIRSSYRHRRRPVDYCYCCLYRRCSRRGMREEIYLF